MSETLDYDALAAKLAAAERVARYESDIAQQALDQMRAVEARIAHLENHIEGVAKDTHKIMVAYEAALPAVDPRIMGFLQHVADGSVKDYTNNHKWAKELIAAIRALPTPTAAELMARIKEGEKE